MVRRGEIYIINLGKGDGSRQSGIRPCIIVSNDKNNKFSPTVNVIPITSNNKKTHLPIHVIIPASCGLNADSIALIEQEVTIDKSWVMTKIGECNEYVMQNINKAIKIQKDIYSPICIADLANYITENAKNNIMHKVIEGYCRDRMIDCVM